ncbi:MAG: response regulator [Clostridia bacterium]|nr:response regulator [Clostridia bacterium]
MARFLVADDSAIARKFIKKILLDARHEIAAEAENGQQAVVEAQKCNPDIITLDIDMPVMGGLEAARTILSQNPGVKIVLVSAHAQYDINSEAAEIGIKHFIVKPVKEPALLEVINKIISDELRPNKEEKEPQVINVNESDENLMLKPEDAVVIHHYSNFRFFKSTVLSSGENHISLRITKDFTAQSIFEEDPLVIGHKYGEDYYMYGCTVKAAELNGNTITAVIDSSERIISNKKAEIVPVSLYIDVKEASGYKRHTAFVRNFSANGIEISSKKEYQEDEIISFDLFIFQKIFSLKAKTVWKSNVHGGFRYGLNLVQIDYDTMKQLRKNIELLKEDYEKNTMSL